MTGICKYAPATAPQGHAAPAGGPAPTTEPSCMEKTKEWAIKFLAVLMTLGAIFAFLLAPGVLEGIHSSLAPSLMGCAEVAYTVGGACAAVVIAIVARTLFCKEKTAGSTDL